jgi:UDP-N-acetylmuramoyl-tripeptide--D-alanyl-D-alanine ligase
MERLLRSELISRCWKTTFSTFSTRGNLKQSYRRTSHTLAIPPETEMAVIELGANHPGETALLAQNCRAEYG